MPLLSPTQEGGASNTGKLPYPLPFNPVHSRPRSNPTEAIGVASLECCAATQLDHVTVAIRNGTNRGVRQFVHRGMLLKHPHCELF